jgi:hypothetical protein
LTFLEDLVQIKGRVMNDPGRVAWGAMIITSGVIMLGSTIAIATLALTPGSFILWAAIETGIIASGASLMGHRSFSMDKGWEIQTLQLQE